MAKPVKKSWEKRLTGRPDPRMVRFVESLSCDKRLYKYDIEGSIAHAEMLAKQKLITTKQFNRIRQALIGISKDIELGKLKLDETFEDIHMAVEAELIKRVGTAGECLHTGRSRNDQVATDMKLWMRDAIGQLQGRITALQKALVVLAARHSEDPMPGYTHLQRAQPVVIGAYLLSFVEQFERDLTRLANCRSSLSTCPLGSGAIAGSSLELDRAFCAEKLRFEAVSRNSMDAVSDRDFCAEFVFDFALTAAHLSRLAEDWILYASYEFGFIRIDDSLCTSSSMMPQKRNPDPLELIRGKTAAVYGDLAAMLVLLKSQPSGYNRDLQEDKRHVFDAADTLDGCLCMAEAIVSSTGFAADRTKAALEEGFVSATLFAEYLVEKGVPFRSAHGLVGSLVAACEKSGRRLSDLGIDEIRKICPSAGNDVHQVLQPSTAISRYKTVGAAGPSQTKLQISFWKKRLAGR